MNQHSDSMLEDQSEPDFSVYVFAWLLWSVVIMMFVMLLVVPLYIINMFAGVIPPYVAIYSLEIGLTALQFVLLGIAAVNIRRKYKSQPVWEPWPLPALVRFLQGLVRLMG